MHYFGVKNEKKLGEGALPDPTPLGRGTPLPKPYGTSTLCLDAFGVSRPPIGKF